ncbi:hypothetical protein [Labedaea rhizosphaerae]|uniref:Uncharacterized protein n=1 Tax=Labedaea rhizosphaerae TaxID=598644 RepID=A0A4R6SML7_LABRH|nr:hypothetical protein [Labedaea rhizosphaerae]TDQ04800.1 hypothetical protein EV186_101758 [Labedaea rhizosphaerae]
MSTPDSLNGVVVLVVIVMTLGYSLACAVFPYRACRACHGVGAFRSSILGAIRLCRRCEGSGVTLRLGRQFYNAVVRGYRTSRDNYRRANRDD